MRVLASLWAPVETETPYGGRVVSHEALGAVWLSCGARRRRETRDGETGPRGIETMTAETRADPRLIEGRTVRFGGGDWAIRAVEAVTPGRARLSLERTR